MFYLYLELVGTACIAVIVYVDLRVIEFCRSSGGGT